MIGRRRRVRAHVRAGVVALVAVPLAEHAIAFPDALARESAVSKGGLKFVLRLDVEFGLLFVDLLLDGRHRPWQVLRALDQSTLEWIRRHDWVRSLLIGRRVGHPLDQSPSVRSPEPVDVVHAVAHRGPDGAQFYGDYHLCQVGSPVDCRSVSSCDPARVDGLTGGCAFVVALSVNSLERTISRLAAITRTRCRRCYRVLIVVVLIAVRILWFSRSSRADWTRSSTTSVLIVSPRDGRPQTGGQAPVVYCLDRLRRSLHSRVLPSSRIPGRKASSARRLRRSQVIHIIRRKVGL